MSNTFSYGLLSSTKTLASSSGAARPEKQTLALAFMHQVSHTSHSVHLKGCRDASKQQGCKSYLCKATTENHNVYTCIRYITKAISTQNTHLLNCVLICVLGLPPASEWRKAIWKQLCFPLVGKGISLRENNKTPRCQTSDVGTVTQDGFKNGPRWLKIAIPAMGEPDQVGLGKQNKTKQQDPI